MKEKEKGDVKGIIISKRLFIIVMVFVSISIIQAASVQINQNVQTGFAIDYPKFTTLIQDQPFNLSTHVFNSSSGLEINSANCNLKLYNQTGYLILNRSLIYSGGGFGTYLLSGNFSNPSLNSFYIYCSLGTDGGFASGNFEITQNGTDFTTQDSIIYSTFFLILIFLFVVNTGAIAKLPASNIRDDENELLTISRLKYLRAVLIPLDYFLIMAITFIGGNIGISLNEQIFGSLFLNIYLAMGWLLLPMIFIWVAWLLYMFWADMGLRKLIERGIPTSNL